MKHTYKIDGMTCGSCKSSVEKILGQVDGVEAVSVNLEKGEATLTMNKHISAETLKSALPPKYKLEEKKITKPAATSTFAEVRPQSKFSQLKPLFLILFYIGTASNLLHYEDWNMTSVMLDFMGLFFIVFSFFKMLDLKGFATTFRMYDPLAKQVPVYAWIYPFIETLLGLMLLFRFQQDAALIATIVVLGITTIGVTKTLLDKRSIKCACLGTALNLPMTEATFIENALMLVMATTLLFTMF